MTDNRVCYDSEFVQNLNVYPICRIPKKGTIVRSHRFNRFMPSNASFSKFKYEIGRILGEDYIVSGDVRINTGGVNRPFDLDLALIHRKDDRIRINIQVDEPYSLFSREARHCIGEDILRDAYFLDRGWVVLRFAEIQIHQNEQACLSFICEFLNKIDDNFDLAPSFLNVSPISEEPMWNLVQAQKWEKVSYRESYLKSNLSSVQESNSEIDRSLNTLELLEEKAVKTSFSGPMELIKDHRNRHIRDERIQFNAEQHKYFVDRIPVPSASSLIRKFFPEFDAYDAASKLRPSNPLFGLSVNDIVTEWNKKGLEAADKGTFLHEQIEKYYLGDNYNGTDEFLFFKDFALSHSFLEPYRCEWRIYDEEYGIAGTIDFVASNHGQLEMYDWKRSKKVIDPSNGKPIEIDRWGKRGIGKLSNVGDTSYNHYCLQQSLYRFILEKNYGVEISKMYLVVLHPDYNKYFKVPVPYLKNYVEFMLNTL